MFMKEIRNDTATTYGDDAERDDMISSIKGAIGTDQKFGFPMFLAVCASYQIVGEDRAHYTVRLYALGKASPDKLTTPTVGEDLLEGQIDITSVLHGEYAD
jgi:hypothetical protein